jgi:hypothetical protein
MVFRAKMKLLIKQLFRMEEKYLSMAQAAEVSPYEQEYLSLLARRGELKAEKIGRNWYTTVEWLNDYLRDKKPGEIIKDEVKVKGETEEKIIKREKNVFQIVLVWIIFTSLAIGAGFFIFNQISRRLEGIEQKTQKNSSFVPEEITRVPNDSGGYDVYGTGKMKLSN